MADLKMKLNTNNEIKVKMKTNDSISMKFDDYQKFKEEDPIFKDSPAYTITNEDIYNWNHKSDFSGSYNDLTNKPNLSNFATYTYVNSGLSNKVDKVEGMGLSENSFTTEEKNKLASLENYDDTEVLNDISDINTALDGKANISDIPTLTSELSNDSGFITKDVNNLTYYPTNDSVNSIVALKQNIIDNDNKLSADLVDDTSTTNKFVTASDITNWNAKSDFSGSYNDLTDKPTIDDAVSTSSTNAVENSVITSYVNDLNKYTNIDSGTDQTYGISYTANARGKVVTITLSVNTLSSAINQGNVNYTIFTLPSGFRPSADLNKMVSSNYGHRFKLVIEASGNVKIGYAYSNLSSSQYDQLAEIITFVI